MINPYLFTRTQIHLFELNTMPEMSVAPQRAIKDPRFNFLINCADYCSLQQTNESITSDNLVCEPFPKRILRNSTFWNRYMKAGFSEKTNYFDLQIPFVLSLRKKVIKVDNLPDVAETKIQVTSYAMINSLGWSTHINLILDAPLKPSEVVDLCWDLRDKVHGIKPYSLNSKPATLKDIFAYYRNLLFTDVFFPNVIYNRPPNFSHLIFIDVMSAQGEIRPFNELPYHYMEVFAQIVRKEKITLTIEEIDGKPTPFIEKMQISPLYDDFANFNLLDFDHGCFTFLQPKVFNPDPTQEPYCFSLNTRDAFMVSYSWLEAYRNLIKHSLLTPKIIKKIKKGRDAIKQVQVDYSNPPVARLWTNHNAIKEFLQTDDNLKNVPKT